MRLLPGEYPEQIFRYQAGREQRPLLKTAEHMLLDVYRQRFIFATGIKSQVCRCNRKIILMVIRTVVLIRATGLLIPSIS
jgi:hypothetical protein